MGAPLPEPARAGFDAEIEARQIFELDDFAQTGAIERFRELDEANPISSMEAPAAPHGT